MNAYIRESTTDNPQKVTEEDSEFDQFLENFKARVYEAFCDNINTPGVVTEIDEAVRRTNIYLLSNTKKITLL